MPRTVFNAVGFGALDVQSASSAKPTVASLAGSARLCNPGCLLYESFQLLTCIALALHFCHIFAGVEHSPLVLRVMLLCSLAVAVYPRFKFTVWHTFRTSCATLAWTMFGPATPSKALMSSGRLPETKACRLHCRPPFSKAVEGFKSQLNTGTAWASNPLFCQHTLPGCWGTANSNDKTVEQYPPTACCWGALAP